MRKSRDYYEGIADLARGITFFVSYGACIVYVVMKFLTT